MRNTVTAKSLYDVLAERVKTNYEGTSGYADYSTPHPITNHPGGECCALCNRLF